MTGVEYAFYDESCTERRKTFFQPFKECSLTYTHNDHYGIIYNVRKKSKIKLPTEGRREIVLTVFFFFTFDFTSIVFVATTFGNVV